jgi:hypothetical protein
LTSLKNSWSQWAGAKEPSSTSQHCQEGSPCVKSHQSPIVRVAELTVENRRLKEELSLIKQRLDREFDV